MLSLQNLCRRYTHKASQPWKALSANLLTWHLSVEGKMANSHSSSRLWLCNGAVRHKCSHLYHALGKFCRFFIIRLSKLVKYTFSIFSFFSVLILYKPWFLYLTASHSRAQCILFYWPLRRVNNDILSLPCRLQTCKGIVFAMKYTMKSW